MLVNLQSELRKLAQPKKISDYQRFFKTGRGEYAEGDKFIGVTVPNTRKVAKKYKDINLQEIVNLLKSAIHEERLCALIILLERYKKSNDQQRLEIINIYLENTKYINNWDLVDLSAHKIVGEYLYHNPHCTTTFQGQALQGVKLLNQLTMSKCVWERRIAIIATFAFIKHNRFDTSLTIASNLINDKHDLIHKAVGWMLREVGKNDQRTEEIFLKQHYKTMPRTMLRYAIEKFRETRRQQYLKGLV